MRLLAYDFVAYAILAQPSATLLAIQSNDGIFDACAWVCDALLLFLALSHGALLIRRRVHAFIQKLCV